MLHSPVRHFVVLCADLVVHVIHIAVHVLHLFLCDLKIDPAERVNRLRKALKSDCDKVGNVEIQIGIEHRNSLLRSSKRIRRITLAVISASYIKESIPVHGNQPGLPRLFIDRADHDRIAPVISAEQILIP